MEQERTADHAPNPRWRTIEQLMARIETLQARRRLLQRDIEGIDRELKPLGEQLSAAWRDYREPGTRPG